MYPYDTIFSIYRRIGMRTPFLVKRSHKGRGVKDIVYRYSREGYTFMVEKVIKENDKYEAYGYCLVDGKRDDFCVRKFYPQNNGEIPNSRANGWVLIDIPGVDMNEIFPVHTANEVIKSGKHRGKTYAEVYKQDPKYIDWLRSSNPHFQIDILGLKESEREKEGVIDKFAEDVSNLRKAKIDDKIPFGKYRGKTYHDVYIINPAYIKWLVNNCDTIEFDKVSFKELME